jgi:hypothetical protein
MCLEFAKGHPKDLRQACDCYKSAAVKGNANAQSTYGFCLQHGVGESANLRESLKYYELSISREEHLDEWGAFEYARCVQYGIGFDSSLEEAADFYSLVVSTGTSTRSRSSFRCLRALAKARLDPFPSNRSVGATVRSQDNWSKVRDLTAPQTISAYLVSPTGLPQGREIGRGVSCHVKLVRDPDTGRLIVIKYFSGSNLDKGNFIQELESLTKLNHPCVLRIIRCVFPKAPRCAELHTEYAERGSLSDVLNVRRATARTENQFWTATRMGIVVCDIVLGMRFVHFREIIHRDLKPSNIFIRENGRALIGDFGSSRFTNDDGTLTGESGTVHYAAPELFQEHAELTGKVDVWGFGMILYEIVSGFPVFATSLSPFDVIRQIRCHYRPIIPMECGGYMEGLIGRCWSDDPSLRPSFEEILREFQDREFAILPGVDCAAIRGAVEGVLTWESDAKAFH